MKRGFKLKILKIPVGGPSGSNSYLAWDDDKNAVIFDPGFPDPRFKQILEEEGLNLQKILLTHGHYDHIGGVKELKELTGAEIIIPEADKEFLTNPELNLGFVNSVPADRLVSEGDEIEIFPGYKLKVLETPGHTEGSACYLADDFLVSGDVLFNGSIGRTDFPGGSTAKMSQSLKRLMELDDNLPVLPGHGENTTIGYEKRYNPFIKMMTT